MNRHGLSDEAWSAVGHLFRRRVRLGRPPQEARRVLEGLLWILATGAPWRDLPARFGAWQTVYGRFRSSVATRYEKLAVTYLALVKLAMARRMLRVAEFSNTL